MNTNTKNIIKWAIVSVCTLLLVFLLIFLCVYAGRFSTMSSIKKLSDYEKYNLYTMDVNYDYDLEKIIASGVTDDQSFVEAVVRECIPFIPVNIKAPQYGCSAFTMKDGDVVLMGRNYDFKNDTSCLIVNAKPQNGYKSVALAALDNISANAMSGIKDKTASLTAPFLCLDGINEKGVAIAVLTLDSTPTRQSTGKQVITTTMAIRLVLDKAASTEEAVKLLEKYDMFASSGRDYHFYITDASGDGRVIEFDPEREDRKLTATPVRAVTNFYAMYADKVVSNQKNGIYGHGKERWNKIEEVFNTSEHHDKTAAWKALEAASQKPNPEDITSNTQWSVVYNLKDLSAEIVIRRDWTDKFTFGLKR